jgi:photosystem II stability/assembly factor-like uncharacterized protein
MMDGEQGHDAVPAPPNDCTVLSIAPACGDVWIATDAGLWRGSVDGWRRAASPAALVVSVIVSAGAQDDPGSVLLAADLAGGIQYSPDGQRWYGAWVDELTGGLTCFAVSPRFAADRMVLAGTERDGILRSTDGGRHWRLANFGLTGYTILALAVSPQWGQREEVFAATDEGIYRSPNGGRAWQRVDARIDALAQTLTVSPQFATDRTLYAGLEDGGLYRSTDGGRSWQLCCPQIRSVNCLWIAPGDPQLFVAGTGDGAILRSADGGEHWEDSWIGTDGVLALAASGDSLYAGLYQGGLLISSDSGRTWKRAGAPGLQRNDPNTR